MKKRKENRRKITLKKGEMALKMIEMHNTYPCTYVYLKQKEIAVE